MPFNRKGETSITGLNGLTVSLTSLTQTSRPTTPFNSGAGIQQTITGLNALGALVIGLGTNADLISDPRQDLSTISNLTGAINRGTTTIANGTANPIAPGDPLYFLIQTGFSTSVVNGVTNAIQNAATSVAVNMTVRASDPRVHITNNTGTINNLGSGQTGTFNITFTGDGAPRRFDLQFVREGTDVVLGSIPVVLGTPIAGNGYEFEDLSDGQHGVGDDFGNHYQSKADSAVTSATGGVYATGQSIPLTLNFNKPVTLAGGTMTVALTSGGTATIAPFSGTTATATYTVAAGETTPALNVSALSLAAGATFQDAFGFDALLTTPTSNLAASASIAVNPVAPTTVSLMTVNNGNAQRSRLDTITVNFSNPVNASDFTTAGAITLTRTSGGPATVVQTGATGANGRITIAPATGMVSSLTLSFDNADSSLVTFGVDQGSLTDGRWQLAIPSLGYTSVLNDPNLLRLNGDSNGDGTINGADLVAFGNSFSSNNALYDFNADGTVNGADLVIFGNRFSMTL
ncbi:hypothetical protein BH11PLA2_BH11PLA2_18970 [soil metagenome]